MDEDQGQWLGGYRLVRRLGAGGAGTVWLAHDGAGQRVALKLLHPALASTEEARRRLAREATTVNRVRSSGVARVLDVEVDDSQPFVVTEFVEGPTLALRLTSGALSPREVAALASSLRHTLEAVHGARIVHRDVKPSNVILSPLGPVLIDFGIAMTEDDDRLTSTGLVSGTAGFTSPELLRAGPASPATDWWSWAATLLEAATGRAPFGTGDSHAVMLRVLQGRPDLDGLPAGVAGVLARALDPDPALRPSPDEVDAALSLPWDRPVAPAQDVAEGRSARTELLGASGPAQAGPEAPHGAASTQVLPAGEAEEAVPGTGGHTMARGAAGTPVSPSSGMDATQVWRPQDPGVDPTRVWPTEAADHWSPSTDELGEEWTPPAPTVPGLPLPGPAASVPPTMGPWTGSGAGPAPEACPGAPGSLPPWSPLVPYTWQHPRPVPLTGPVLMLGLAVLPVVLGAVGALGVLVVVLALTLVGVTQAQRELRRVRHGGVRGSDSAVALAGLPLHLVRSAFIVGGGLVVGVVAAAILWLLARATVLVAPPGVLWPLDVLLGPSTPGWQGRGAELFVVVWVLAAGVLVVMWSLPTSRRLREGTALVIRVLLPPRWSRAVLGVLVAVVLVATWWILTGGRV